MLQWWASNKKATQSILFRDYYQRDVCAGDSCTHLEELGEERQSLSLQAKRHLTSKMSECGAPTIPAGIQWLEAFFRDYYLRNIQADQVLTFTFIYKKIVERIKYKHLENAIKALLRCPGTGRQRIKKLTRFRAFKLAEVITIIFHWLCYRQWPL